MDIPRIEDRLGVSISRVADFCRVHGIRQFDLFGSILGDDFGAASDVDVMVAFEAGRTPSLFGHMDIEQELADVLGRRVDLVTMDAVLASENSLLRDEILGTCRTVYAQQAR